MNESNKARNEWRRLHGKTVAAVKRSTGFISPACLPGLEISQDNTSLTIRTDSREMSGAWQVTNDVSRFFARRRKFAENGPCLVFEVLHVDCDGAIVRVSGPTSEVEKYFGNAALWPDWVRAIGAESSARVLQAPIASTRFEVWQECHQSEAKRDEFARTPSQPTKQIKRALEYVRASVAKRLTMEHTPRPIRFGHDVGI